MVEFYLLTFPRFPLRKKEHNSYFGKNRTHDFRTTSRCAGYLLDHSGDEVLPYIIVNLFSYVLVFFVLIGFHCMAINGSVQYNGGLLPDIILLDSMLLPSRNPFKCHEEV